MTGDPLAIARELIEAGVPVFAAPPALGSDGQWDPEGGTGSKEGKGCGYHLPIAWQKTVPTLGWIDPTVPGFADKGWRPGWALGAVMGHALDLLDVDPRNGGQATREGLLEAGLWPSSYGTAATPSGGTHDFVRALGVGSRDDVQPGFDVKSGQPDGTGRGFAFIAPTVKLNKVTGEPAEYRWTVAPTLAEIGEHDDSGEGIAEMVRALRGPKPSAPSDDPFDTVTTTHTGPIAQGDRHRALVAYAGSLRHRAVPLHEARVLMEARRRDCAQPPAALTPVTEAEAQDKLADVYRRYAAGEGPATVAEHEDPAQAVNGISVRERWPRIDWHVLWAQPDTDEWIIEPILPARRLVAIYSAPKVGKSLLLLELAVGVARGTEVLGVTPDRPRRVLYVDFENDPRGDVRSRLQAMGVAPDDLDRLDYLSYPVLSGLDSPAGSAELMAAVAEYKSEVVVIDTVSRSVRGEENSNDTWISFYNCTGLALKREGVALIRLDHSGKDEAKGMRGGSAKVGDVDAVWRLSRVSDTVFRLDCTDKRMPIAEQHLVLHREANPLRHRVDGRGRAASVEAKVKELTAVLDAAGLDPSAGQPAARAVFKHAGQKVGGTLVAEVVRRRKERLELPPTPGGSSPDPTYPQSPGGSSGVARRKDPEMPSDQQEYLPPTNGGSSEIDPTDELPASPPSKGSGSAGRSEVGVEPTASRLAFGHDDLPRTPYYCQVCCSTTNILIDSPPSHCYCGTPVAA